ncbi:MAG TPA: flippase [Clostridia bacterium]|nr:flippase [Clostridia bacterium]
MNVVLNMILSLAGIAVGMITFPYFSRILLPEGMGTNSFITSFMNYFVLFANLGIPTYAIKECAKVKDNREELSATVQELYSINIVTSAIALSVYSLCIVFVPELKNFYLLAIIIGLGNITGVLNLQWLLQAMEDYKFIAIKNLSITIVAVILEFVFVKSPDDLFLYVLIGMAGVFLSNMTNIFYIKKYVDFRRTRKLKIARHFKPVLILFAMSVASSIYTNLDSVMLGFMRDNYTVGIYGASIKINRILVAVITSISAVLLPRMSRYFKENKMEEFNKLMARTVGIVVTLALPLILYFIIFAEDIILWLLGADYYESIVPMQVSIFIILFIGLSNLTGIQYMLPLGLEKHVMISVILGAVVDFVINIITIPPLGALGSAIATASAELTVLTYQLIILRKNITRIFSDLNWKFIILFTVICGGVLICMNIFVDLGYFLNSIINMGITAVLFIVISILTKNPIVDETLNILRLRKKTVKENSDETV